MRFRIRHATTYRYDRPVALGRHILRMHPRPDPYLRVEDFRISIHPPPSENVTTFDLDGNHILSATFEGTTQQYLVLVESEGETSPRPPLAQMARNFLPVFLEDSPQGPAEVGGTVLLYPSPAAVSAPVAALTRSVLEESGPGAFDFLIALARRIHNDIRNAPRLTGPPLPPELTLQERSGSCRDLAVLFIASCRSLGFETRFVSGYIPAAPGERQHMHAWAEVRIPKLGWYPFDPTHSEGVGEDHIPVAAAFAPADAAPITGVFSSLDGGYARSEMSVDLKVVVEASY